MVDIKDYLIASYRCNGKTNDDIDRDVLMDLSGNGHDIVLKNFGFALGSGYGVYDTNATSIVMNSSDYSITVKSLGNSPKIRIAFSVSGLPNEDTGYNYLRIALRANDQSLIYDQIYRYDGEYVFEWENTNNESFYCTFYNGGSSSYSVDGLKILIHPNEYGGALVFDGIDDYGICEDFPAIKDFTFVYKRINLNPSKTYQAFISKPFQNDVERSIIEHTYTNANVTIVGSTSKSISSVYDPAEKVIYVTPTSYDGLNLGGSTFEPLTGLLLGTYSEQSSAYCWNGAFYALDIYDRTLNNDELQIALNRINDMDINWEDGVGEVTDQPLTVSPGAGSGDAAVSFGSVMNKGLDRTLELEITTPKGIKKTLTVNQEGCRQAYITSDGKRWLTSDNRVYGVLKSDAPCECTDTCRECTLIGFDYVGTVNISGKENILIRPLPDNPTKTTVIHYSKDAVAFMDADKYIDDPSVSNKCRWNNGTHAVLTNRAYIYDRPQLTSHQVQYAYTGYSSMPDDYVNKIELLIVPASFTILVPGSFSLTSPDSRGMMDVVPASSMDDRYVTYDISDYNNINYGSNSLSQCSLVNKTGSTIVVRNSDTGEDVSIENGKSYSLDTYTRQNNSTDHGKFHNIELYPVG